MLPKHTVQSIYLARDTSNEVWRRCGGLGNISVFSFYANKLVTTGEGGMVLTNDPKIADQARSLRNLCFHRERRFYHTELGHNFRMTNLQAAIGLAQIERMPETISKKRWIGETYTQRLKHIPSIQLPVEEPWARQVYWMYGLVLDERTGLTAVEFARRLLAEGIETRPFFLGMHEQPVFIEPGIVQRGEVPGCRTHRPPGSLPAFRFNPHRSSAGSGLPGCGENPGISMLPDNHSPIGTPEPGTSPRGLVSIILATYNESENISDMISAIFASVPDPVEIIVVDDNSPDQTWKIAT